MRFVLAVLLFVVLLGVAPVLALIALLIGITALLMIPLIWLLLVPFRLVALAVNALLQTVEAVLLFPARLLRLGAAH